MVYYRSTDHAVNAGALHIRFSNDYGATWTAEDTDLSGDPVVGFPMNPPDPLEEGTDANQPQLYIAPNGNLIIHMWRIAWIGPVRDGTYQSVSSDGGKTWSEPSQIDFGDIADDTIIFTTEDHVVYDGTIYISGAYWTGSAYKQVLTKSEDNGATWVYVSDIGTLASESGIEYIGNNQMIALMRSGNNTQTYRVWSSDTGASWGSKEEITNVIPSSGRHRIWTQKRLEKSSAEWWDDNHLVVCGFVMHGDNEIRQSALWFSKDRGVNWSDPCYVDEIYTDTGYGDLFYNPNTGEYIFMCYRGTREKADLVQYNVSVNWGS